MKTERWDVAIETLLNRLPRWAGPMLFIAPAIFAAWHIGRIV